ncbi:hypothetical protein CEUSTIGMA_g9737.t1 [Chlamydomonas eustigma]|uniref:Uncharacterized protein n=1 Tax=Chlamydomonas eustigma TaxID=1157962 RepID=A0A250XGV3_9CHLO|nr:hypothetical protein CEUSTIGMA_g9737.t1 [Chlamydomonas eustigma]|eukprot:GAX82308.1 hypothetical protein CEUSTIGMA_g9737.t1 [Chlamydomonas eustigma]
MLSGLFFRGKAPDRGKQHSDEDIPRHVDKRKDDERDWTYQASLILLAILLLSTLYLLRCDNAKLGVAEKNILKLKDYVNVLHNRHALMIEDGFSEHHIQQDSSVDAQCQRDYANLKKQLEEVKKENEEHKQRTAELKKQVKSLYRKAAGMQGGE